MWLAAATLALVSVAPATASAVFSHHDWQRVLERFVDDHGLVDYATLRQDRGHLDRYLTTLKTVGPRSEPGLFPEEAHRLAYYLNAYNALVFGAVLNLDPDTDSIWGVTGTGLKFFVLTKHSLDGQILSLKYLEDELVREQFQDPRVHAALNCASRACPRLPREPFAGDRLDAQLDAAMTEFVNEDRNVHYDPESNTVYLSRIFNWFRSDFEDWQSGGAGHLLTYINRYRDENASIPLDVRIRFLDYDKRLNRR